MIDSSVWQKVEHTQCFDSWSRLTDRELEKLYESFNEIKLLKKYCGDIKGTSFFEIGCATGELYRYLTERFPNFSHVGFDISKNTILRVKEKSPKGEFFVCSPDLINDLAQFEKPSVVFSRDVVHHQLKPYDFLNTLLKLPTEALIVRIRTLDKGESILDPEQSCQWHYEGWVPYLVLNSDEVIETILKTRRVKLISVLKHYQILGGHNGRYLPKQCYDPTIGTAETAFFVQFSQEDEKPKIVVEVNKDSIPAYSLFQRSWRFVKNRIVWT